MPARGVTRGHENRRIRQEALRDQLSAQGHVQHLVEIANKLTDLPDPGTGKKGHELEALDIQRLRGAADIHKGLVDKYLPTLKQVDSTVEMTIADASDSELDARINQILASFSKGNAAGSIGGESQAEDAAKDSDVLP